MKFVLGITLLLIPAAIAGIGILFGTGNMHIITEPTGEYIQNMVSYTKEHIPSGPSKSGNAADVAVNTASISPEEAVKRLVDLKVRKNYDPELPEYNRENWGSWSDQNQDCRNTRADVLQSESSETVSFPNGCIVSTGQWTDPWSGQTFQEASQLDVDHHVPIANAHYSGGHAWSADKKQEYYNDTELPVALNAMTNTDNQAKSAQGPERWQPRQRRCAYATGWVAVKSKYGLSITRPERTALADMLSTCTKTK